MGCGPCPDLVGSFRLFMLWLDSAERTHSGLLHVRAVERSHAACRLSLSLDGGGELVLPGQAVILARACQLLFPSPTGPLCSIVVQRPEPHEPADSLSGAILLSDLPGSHGVRSGRCLLERIRPVEGTAHAWPAVDPYADINVQTRTTAPVECHR